MYMMDSIGQVQRRAITLIDGFSLLNVRALSVGTGPTIPEADLNVHVWMCAKVRTKWGERHVGLEPARPGVHP